MGAALLFTHCCSPGRGRCSIGFLERLGAFLAAHLDGLSAELDTDDIRPEFAVAGGTGGFLHGNDPPVSCPIWDRTIRALSPRPPLSNSLATCQRRSRAARWNSAGV